jgi:hypothetical protein
VEILNSSQRQVGGAGLPSEGPKAQVIRTFAKVLVAEYQEPLAVALLEADVHVALVRVDGALGCQARRVSEEHLVVLVPIDRVKLLSVQIVVTVHLDSVLPRIDDRWGM